ncbi:unnamed protein product, partial [Ectocarpus sp. 12 AP-2014]
VWLQSGDNPVQQVQVQGQEVLARLRLQRSLHPTSSDAGTGASSGEVCIPAYGGCSSNWVDRGCRPTRTTHRDSTTAIRECCQRHGTLYGLYEAAGIARSGTARRGCGDP